MHATPLYEADQSSNNDPEYPLGESVLHGTGLEGLLCTHLCYFLKRRHLSPQFWGKPAFEAPQNWGLREVVPWQIITETYVYLVGLEGEGVIDKICFALQRFFAKQGIQNAISTPV